MTSEEAPLVWKSGGYTQVAEYCLKDCQLVYDLWKHGQENKSVKGYSIENEVEKTLEVEW